jgi:integrase
MAVERVGIYRKWLEPAPKDSNEKPIPKSEWAKKRHHHWIVRWYGTNKRYGKVFRTRKEAERYALELQERINLGRPDRPKKITLADFKAEHEKLMQGQVACGTLQDQMRALKLFEKFIGCSTILHNIRHRDAEDFIADRLKSGISPATANKDIRTFRRRGYVAEGQNPFVKLKQRKKARRSVRYVTIEEYHRLMNVVEDLWWKSLISVAYGSGLRRNEILILTWVDIDFEKQLIHVRPKAETPETIGWEPKDHEARMVPMADETARLLAEMQLQTTEGNPYIFISPERLQRIRQRKKDGKWNSRSQIINNVREDFQNIRCLAGLAEFTLHDLRRSAITNWSQRLPIQVVQKLAGHSDMNTTEQYYLAVREGDILFANHVLKGFLDQTEDD